jgi:hypothetical protein
VLGGLLLLGAFGLAARSILRDYELRTLEAWNGITGTTAGIASHRANQTSASFAATCVEALTAILAIALAIPRRVERAWFRWTGWTMLLVAALLAGAALLGLVGISLHGALASFDPQCPLDGECRRPLHAMRPDDWRATYLGLLAFGALVVSATLAAAVGARWLFWAAFALARRAAR